jgi:acyl carrier protein
MATREEFFNSLKGILVDRLKVDGDTITPEATFLEDLGLDSIDLMTMVMALEEEFGIEVDDSEVEGIETVSQALDLLTSKAKISA